MKFKTKEEILSIELENSESSEKYDACLMAMEEYANQFKPASSPESKEVESVPEFQVSANGQYRKCKSCKTLQAKHKGDNEWHSIQRYELPEQNMPKSESSIEDMAFTKSVEHYGFVKREDNDYEAGFIVGASQFKTSPIEVIKKRLEERIKVLVKTRPRYSNARINELLDILKLIQ